MPKIPEKINIHYDEMPILSKETLLANPITLFDEWMQFAIQQKIRNANAVALATCGKDGAPSNRMVLLKEYYRDQFIFYTNYGSAKARDLAENPRASLLFFWEPLQRQIRIQGSVRKTDRKTSAQYFLSRSRGSQIGAYVSEFQSQTIENRQTLTDREKNLTAEFSQKEIPVPEFWGGYILTAQTFEFWKGRRHRLHDRILFTKKNTAVGTVGNAEDLGKVQKESEWFCQRLAP